MTKLPPTPAMLRVARRVVWFRSPEEALADPVHFLAHVMTYGTAEDVAAVRDELGDAAFREALDHAPAGVFDPQSWAYWHLRYGRRPPPPLRERVGVVRPRSA